MGFKEDLTAARLAEKAFERQVAEVKRQKELDAARKRAQDESDSRAHLRDIGISAYISTFQEVLRSAYDSLSAEENEDVFVGYRIKWDYVTEPPKVVPGIHYKAIYKAFEIKAYPGQVITVQGEGVMRTLEGIPEPNSLESALLDAYSHPLTHIEEHYLETDEELIVKFGTGG